MKSRLKTLRGALSNGFQRWAGWMEKQGFYVMVGLCLAVVAGSALWARQPTPESPPESVVVGDAADFQQKLADVMKTVTPEITPAPTPTPPPRWIRPLSGEIVREFSPNELVYQPTMDGWAVHPAVDVAGRVGEPVLSPTDGKVYAVENDARYGLTVTIKLEDGSMLSLMGLKSASVAMGDNLTTGQSVGTAGGSMAAEASDPVHIHIFWEKNGKTLDSSLMWD
ncbi:MAG: M23 family metallopeptidase [Oscillospiraceae bacterium]|nr:M23 family metallopeptidase [Oscillospiraceae bacterium]